MSGLPPGGTGWRKEGKAPARQRRHSPVRRGGRRRGRRTYAPRRQPRGVTQAGRAGVVEAWPLTVSTRDAGGRARRGACAVAGAVTRTLRAQSSEVSATRRREEGECCKERRSRVLEPYEGIDASSSQPDVFFCPTKKLVNPSFYECALTSSCRTPAAGAAPPPRAAASRARASRSQGWRRGSTRARPAAESPPQRARPARRTLPPHPIGR